VGEPVEFEVGPEDAGARLDLYLTRRLTASSRSRIQRWIMANLVAVDGRPRKAGFALSPGEIVRVTPPPPEPAHLVPEDLPLKILYEDGELLVVDKPAGMVVHPGAGNRRGTLANALAFHFDRLSRGDTLRPGIVHRLDKGTSGILVVAKSEGAHDDLARQFQARTVRKAYLALLHGLLRPETGEISRAIGRDSRVRTRMSSRTHRPKPALTRYEVIRYFRRFTYVRAFPVTGRTHQIRVHFASRGHPVVGDETYRTEASVTGVKSLKRLFLHATLLEFDHPKSGERLAFEVPLPGELADLLETLGE
jgi:23S rRNA pseudouridine1911/1915/1917 synthase